MWKRVTNTSREEETEASGARSWWWWITLWIRPNGWLSRLFWPCESISLSKVWRPGLRIGTQISITWATAASNEITGLSPSSRGDERDNLFSSFSLPLACANTPTLCRLFTDCGAAALKETVQSLTCVSSTFICSNKKKRHGAFPNHRKPPEIAAACASRSSRLFSSCSPSSSSEVSRASFLYLLYYLFLFDLEGPTLFKCYCVFPSLWELEIILCTHSGGNYAKSTRNYNISISFLLWVALSYRTPTLLI